MYKTKILNELNNEQKKAVENYMGPSFVIAGPGSGKTHMLINRTAYMIRDGVNPENILLFTFTRKAANEIKERLISKVGEAIADKVMVSTYHGFCSRMLRRYANYTDRTASYSIFDEIEKNAIMKEILKQEKEEFTLNYMKRGYISRAKNRMSTPEEEMQKADKKFKRKAAEYYRQYEEILRLNNARDYDDLIADFVRLLTNYPNVREEILEKYQYIMADEAHDSSTIDLEFIKLISTPESNICFILDEDQSIYMFRGSRIDKVMELDKHYKNLKKFELRTNYRSTQTIVNASKSLIKNNESSTHKDLVSNNDVGNKIFTISTENKYTQAQNVAGLIKNIKKNGLADYKDIGIIYRVNNSSKEIEPELIKNKIPYKLLTSIEFYNREEINDILSYVRYISNYRDTFALTRVMKTLDSIGKTTIERVLDNLEEYDYDLEETVKNITLRKNQRESLESFIAFTEQIKEMEDNNRPVHEIIRHIIDESHYVLHIQAKYGKGKETTLNKINNLLLLIDIAKNADTLIELADKVKMDSDVNTEEEDECDDKVNLTTAHSSKGLEFKVVIMVDVTDDMYPGKNANHQIYVEEERRLFYVAITRAKELLFLITPRKKIVRGIKMTSKPSRFLNEISPEYLDAM